MVVDDSRSLRAAFGDWLRESGFDVLEASDAEEALQLIEESGPPDLIVLDVVMPGMAGIDLLLEIRTKYSKVELPILMATSRSESSDIITALQRGANDYITKPLDMPVALARIESHLATRQQAASMRPGSKLPPTSPQPGVVLDDRYELLSVVGAGGFAVVYKARQVSTGQTVAVKILRADRLLRRESADAEIERFQREMKLIAQLSHPHIVRLVDSGSVRIRDHSPAPDRVDSDTVSASPSSSGSASQEELEIQQNLELPFLVTEFLDGESLATWLLREGSCEIQRAVDLMLPILSAVHEAHGLGVIHRDLKPQNVFLVRSHDGKTHPKVLDFGVAKLSGEDGATLTDFSSMVGTPKYLSPEQARGLPEIDPRSDQYALGTMLYRILTGDHPYRSQSALGYIHLIAKGDVESPRQRCPEIPEQVEQVILRAMSSDPEDRFPNLHAFGRALLGFGTASARVRWARAFGFPSDIPPA